MSDEVTVLTLSKYNTRFGSRFIGESFRNEISESLNNNQTVVIDFDGVEFASMSFIDEMIGKLYREYPEDFLREKLRITNADSEIMTLVRRYIRKNLEAEE